MDKEGLIKANRYAEELKNKLSASTPEKHKNHPDSYKQFLERELKAVNKKIDFLKLIEIKK